MKIFVVKFLLLYESTFAFLCCSLAFLKPQQPKQTTTALNGSPDTNGQLPAHRANGQAVRGV